jgi:hypothetical protein
MFEIRRTIVLRLALPLLLLFPAFASAQSEQPIGPFAADVRGMLGRHKVEPSVATDLGVTTANVPERTVGVSGGVHWYPWRFKSITFGLGAEGLIANSSRTVEPTSETPTSPVVRRHFSEFSGQLSFNFGHRNGWSYISGGIGRSKLYLDREDAPVSDAPGRNTLNYGAGARWFTNHHMAFSVEIRWYSVASPAVTPEGGVFEPQTTLMVVSAGIGLR